LRNWQLYEEVRDDLREWIIAKEVRVMSKSESENEVLSREEMKKTKGGAGAEAAASEALRRPVIEETSLQAEETILPASQPAAGAASPSAQEDLLRRKR
jgi:hypothetical protein